MSAARVYPLNTVVLIREETQRIIQSVKGFHFDRHASTVALKTIQHHLGLVYESLGVNASEETLASIRCMSAWLVAFFRTLEKASHVHKSYDYLFYGAALTIEKFLDDHHL